ncbi:hypothetical protein [Streptomyces nigra]|uniref:hypothetical protein n=1 Tax=Streptomyces nigra TaxID=1827580 RepID=UPI0034242D61
MGTASHTVVIEVIKCGNSRRTSSRSSLQGVPAEVAAELAHDIAGMGRALTDGFHVAAAAGDDTDFDRYAGDDTDFGRYAGDDTDFGRYAGDDTDFDRYAGDDADFDLYAGLAADALESLISTRLREYAQSA